MHAKPIQIIQNMKNINLHGIHIHTTLFNYIQKPHRVNGVDLLRKEIGRAHV